MRIVLCHESGSDKDDSSAYHPLGCGVYCSLDAKILFKCIAKMLFLDLVRTLMKLDVKSSLCSV